MVPDSRLIRDCIQTYDGSPFWPLEARPEEIRITDIAHALSMICRYGGHCLRFYSVAEHSVHVARLASAQNKLWGLLHDAPEGLGIVDVVTPVKRQLVGYSDVEDRLMLQVCQRFGLDPVMPQEIKELDLAVFGAEIRQNMRSPKFRWSIWPDPAPVQLQYWTPRQAEAEFLRTFLEIVDQGEPAVGK